LISKCLFTINCSGDEETPDQFEPGIYKRRLTSARSGSKPFREDLLGDLAPGHQGKDGI